MAEYWIIDSRPRHRTAEFFMRDESGQFRQVPASDGVYRSERMRDLWWSPAWLWDGSRPLSRVTEVLGRDRLIAALGG